MATMATLWGGSMTSERQEAGDHWPALAFASIMAGFWLATSYALEYVWQNVAIELIIGMAVFWFLFCFTAVYHRPRKHAQ